MLETAEVDVARPKKKKAAKPTAPSRRLSVQATEEWIGWVERGADHCRTDVSKLADAALAEYLKARGFEDKPPRRIP